jgi:hypothetical protein
VTRPRLGFYSVEHAVVLRLNSAGALFAPAHVAVRVSVRDRPAPMVPFVGRFDRVTSVPAWWTAVSCSAVICWPSVYRKRIAHALMGVRPVLVTLMVAVNSPVPWPAV